MGLSEQVHSCVKDWNPSEGWGLYGTNRNGGWVAGAPDGPVEALPRGERYLWSPLLVCAMGNLHFRSSF